MQIEQIDRDAEPVDIERLAWIWLNDMVEGISDENASDIAYSADAMVDAYIAGFHRANRHAARPDDSAVERARVALDMAAFRMQLMVDRMPRDEDGKGSKALCQSWAEDARAAIAALGE